MITEPVHLLAVPGADHTMCGLRRSTREPRYPVVVAEFAPAHVAGWGMRICTECASAQMPTLFDLLDDNTSATDSEAAS